MKATSRIMRKIREGVAARGFYFLLDQEMPEIAPHQEQELLESLDTLARSNGWQMIDVRNCSAHLFLSAGRPQLAPLQAALMRGMYR